MAAFIKEQMKVSSVRLWRIHQSAKKTALESVPIDHQKVKADLDGPRDGLLFGKKKMPHG